MTRFISLSILGIILAVLFTACSVQKRHHLPGYYVEWNTHLNKKKTVELIDLNDPANKLGKLDEKATISYSDLPQVEIENTITESNHDSDFPTFQTNEPANLTKNTKSHTLKERSKKKIPTRLTKSSLFSKQNTLKTLHLENNEPDKTVRLIIALICLGTGAFPLAVYFMVGRGKEFIISIILTTLYVLCLLFAFFVLSAAISTFSFSITALLLILGGLILSFTAFVHAGLVIIRNI